jgi:hypothetical protein
MDTSLSTYLTASPKGARKLIATHKGIQTIPLLPSPFKSLEHLDLSHNDIAALGGLLSFPRLKVLFLAYNQVTALEELMCLGDLQILETVDLQGNPVTRYFSYRDTVVLNCQRLRMLDEIEVSPDEVMIAQQITEQRERYIGAIISNEETIAKLEHIQKRLKLHSELISEGRLEAYSPLSVPKLLSSLSLTWPSAFTASIRDSLELKVSERLHSSQQDWEALYIECLDRQDEFISTLTQAAEHLAKECLAQWEKRATHLRDWSLGPRQSGDLGLGTLSLELESVLNEHRQLQETTVIQQRQLEAVLARNEELEGHLSVLQYRSGEDAVMKSTIDEGITYVIERFKDSRLMKMGLNWLQKAAKIEKRRRVFREEIMFKRLFDIRNMSFAAWKWSTKIEQFIKYREANRTKQLQKRSFRAWFRTAFLSLSLSALHQHHLLNQKSHLLHQWSLYTLFSRSHRLNTHSALFQYGRFLVKRVLQGWRQLACQRLPSRYWRDLHAEKLKLKALTWMRTKALAKRSNERRAVILAQTNLAQKVIFGLKIMLVLKEKKMILSQKKEQFMEKRALNQLKENQIAYEKANKSVSKALQHYGKKLLFAGIHTLQAWKELGNERKRRLSRVALRCTRGLARLALHHWKFLALIPTYMDRTLSFVVSRKGPLLVRKVIKHWKRLVIQRHLLTHRAEIWKSRCKIRSISRVFTVWLSGMVISLRTQLQECKTASTRLENSLTARETELKSMHSSHQKLRFQLDNSPEALDTKRSLDSHTELTSRPDARRLQLLEIEFAAARSELAALRAQKTDKSATESAKRELASARALCSTLTAELQKTSAALQSQQTDFHLQINELTEQLTESRAQLQRISRENRELKAKDKESERYTLDLTQTSLAVHSQESARGNPEPSISPRIGLDSEERRVRQQLESLKRERTAIRGEIESRLRDLDDTRSAMSTPAPTLSSLGELSVRLSQLESRMTRR